MCRDSIKQVLIWINSIKPLTSDCEQIMLKSHSLKLLQIIIKSFYYMIRHYTTPDDVSPMTSNWKNHPIFNEKEVPMFSKVE